MEDNHGTSFYIFAGIMIEFKITLCGTIFICTITTILFRETEFQS